MRCVRPAPCRGGRDRARAVCPQCSQRVRVLLGGGFEWRHPPAWHRSVGRQRSMLQQAGAQVRQVAVGIARGRNALVDLKDMNVGPGHIFVGQLAQHDPRGLPPLTAMMKRPRAATAARASAAMMAAAFLARGGIRKNLNLHSVSTSLPPSPGVRRTRSAWRKAACRRSRLRRAS